MLSDPFYAGVIRFRGKIVEGLHDPMVTKDEYLRVQQLLRKRRRNNRKRRRNNTIRLI